MEMTFASVVENVQELSIDEKTELKDLLEAYIIEDRRNAILKECEDGRREYEDGKLIFSSNIDQLMAVLND
ncbi:hypothetical protein BH10ACI2_BH10ACI2_22560 [soil metagenome]